MRTTLLSDRIDLLKRTPLFADLSDKELATLVDDFRLRQYRTDDILFHQGDRGAELYVIIDGKVRIYKISGSGKETTIQIFSKYDIIGEFSPIDNQPRSATAKAIGPCQLLEMRGDRFLHHMRTMPDLSLAIARLLTTKLRWTAAYAETIAQYDAAGRLLHLLLLYNDQFGEEIKPGEQYTLDLALNQTDLASLIGARREWVNRLLKDWLKRGLVSFEAGKIIFHDLQKAIDERNSRLDTPSSKW